MEKLDSLAQKEYGENSAEDRHQMDETPGSVGPDFSNCPIPENESENRREDGYIDDGAQ